MIVIACTFIDHKLSLWKLLHWFQEACIKLKIQKVPTFSEGNMASQACFVT
jgi:hypothetical protein